MGVEVERERKRNSLDQKTVSAIKLWENES